MMKRFKWCVFGAAVIGMGLVTPQRASALCPTARCQLVACYVNQTATIVDGPTECKTNSAIGDADVACSNTSEPVAIEEDWCDVNVSSTQKDKYYLSGSISWQDMGLEAGWESEKITTVNCQKHFRICVDCPPPDSKECCKEYYEKVQITVKEQDVHCCIPYDFWDLFECEGNHYYPNTCSYDCTRTATKKVILGTYCSDCTSLVVCGAE